MTPHLTGSDFNETLARPARPPCLVLLGVAALIAATILGAPAAADAAPTARDELTAGFEDPPTSARPLVWWHWLSGNVTKDGIAKDPDWMKRVGIAGVQNFDVSFFTPQIVERPLVYMTAQWQDAFRFAARTADELGLEMAIAAAPGWSETGGPWVKPENGLKKLVWSEVEVAASVVSHKTSVIPAAAAIDLSSGYPH